MQGNDFPQSARRAGRWVRPRARRVRDNGVRFVLALAFGVAAFGGQGAPLAMAATQTTAVVVSPPPLNPPPDLTPVNCNQEHNLATQNTDTPATVLFWNQTLAPVQVDSLDTVGLRHFQFVLQPGDSLLQNTFLTVPWLVTDNSDPAGNGTGRGLCFAIFLATAQPGTAHVLTHAETYDPGCLTNVLPANDDGSTTRVLFGFTMDFFGVAESSGFINNNGNLTFNNPQSTFTPFSIAGSGVPILAPFFADVWTFGQSYQVHYGQITVGGHSALCVDWAGVGYYPEDARHLNSFQMIIVDRPDLGTSLHGDVVNLIYNYDQVQWESGLASGGNINGLGGQSARVGYSNGVQSFELDGSGINGAFLDSNPGGLVNRQINSSTQGQLVFLIPNATTVVTGTIQGHVLLDGTTPIPNALVVACQVVGGNFCVGTNTNQVGFFSQDALPDGQWRLTANVPGSVPPGNLPPGTAGPFTILNSNTITGADIIVHGPTPPPAGAGIVNINTDGSLLPPRFTVDGSGNLIPIVYWGRPTHTFVRGCPDALMATYHVSILDNGTVFDGNLTQTAPGSGTYFVDLPPFIPNHGNTLVTFHFVCADPLQNSDRGFSIYIDPSGTVSTLSGVTIAGSTITLLREDAFGNFNQVPDGDVEMSPANRNNPDHSDGLGQFGWDVAPGTYRVRADFTTADGIVCVSATTPDLVVTSQPITNIVLQLDCLSDNADPNEPAGADNVPASATPELDSLVLFGTGATGAAGYVLTRLRAVRRRRDEQD